MADDNVIPFRLAPTPKHMSDADINIYWELAVALMHATAVQANPETMFSEPTDLEAYIDCNGVRCFRPKGEGERLRKEKPQRDYDERQRHLEHVRRELEALRLDEIDGDWRDHFTSQDAAALHYRREIAEYIDWGGGQPKRVLGRDANFDADLEDRNEG